MLLSEKYKQMAHLLLVIRRVLFHLQSCKTRGHFAFSRHSTVESRREIFSLEEIGAQFLAPWEIYFQFFTWLFDCFMMHWHSWALLTSSQRIFAYRLMDERMGVKLGLRYCAVQSKIFKFNMTPNSNLNFN
jgi:hypothetical protein